MRVAAVIITFNRVSLLERALASVANQKRKADYVYIVSNSTEVNFLMEQEICLKYNWPIFQNQRTPNYTGALNSAIEKIIKQLGIEKDIYFASLDDDDEWLPDYLSEIAFNNADCKNDVVFASLARINHERIKVQILPEKLTEDDFLKGNPGIGGPNTFIRLITLLMAGGFDESMISNVDRDLFIRVFLLKPTYVVIQKHLVNAYTDNERLRVTNNEHIRKQSFQYFYYKYSYLMTDAIKKDYFSWAKRLFFLEETDITDVQYLRSDVREIPFEFEEVSDFNLIIGFISDSIENLKKLLNQIVSVNVNPRLILIIDNTENTETSKILSEDENYNGLKLRIIHNMEWLNNLKLGVYGKYLKDFNAINSIPLGRTILHYHLHAETTEIDRPVYWIIDDDISLTSTVDGHSDIQSVNFTEILKKFYGTTDAIIGGISNDPPLPTLSCIRGQLVDFLHSHYASNQREADHFQISLQSDYYYDLSDAISNHVEAPIYHTHTKEEDLYRIFSGKALSRPAIQYKMEATNKTVSKRGANTLVFNRDLLTDYPVINLEVNNRLARRGDLLWAILNQQVSGKKIIEHTFALNHSRPPSEFSLQKELDKAAYDIIGYGFNKSILEAITQIKQENVSLSVESTFQYLEKEEIYTIIQNIYYAHLEHRKTKFLMNYYRIKGLVKILSVDFEVARKAYSQFSDEKSLNNFYQLLSKAKEQNTIQAFITQFLSGVFQSMGGITEVYDHTVKIFLNRVKEAKAEVENIHLRKAETSFTVSVETIVPYSNPCQLLFTTSTGLFLYDEINQEYKKLLDGKYYGLTRYKNTWFAAHSNNKGNRNHIENNRITDISSFELGEKNQIENLKTILFGIPGEIHQIDVYKQRLYIPHTDFNQVLFIDLDTILSAQAPLNILNCKSFELPVYKYSHLNSIHIVKDKMYLIAHNFTMKTNKMSDLIVFDSINNTTDIIPLNAHSAHNIFVDGNEYFYCDSNNKILYKNITPFFKAEKLLRGFSVTENHILVGGSDVCFDNYKRFSNNCDIYVLDRKTGLHLKTIKIPGLGDIYEIRQLFNKDESFSDSRNHSC